MELWDAYTEKEERTGQLLVRGEPIPQGVLHLVCEALVRHTDGSYLVMQRSYEKSTFPGCWEATAGGAAQAGEDPQMCIRREVREVSIRIKLFKRLSLHKSRKDNTVIILCHFTKLRLESRRIG